MARPKNPSPTRRRPRDDLEDYIDERTARNPDFPRLMGAAAERKRLLRELAAARRAAGFTQTDVAARMKTSASAVARLEQGEMNPTVATLQRFAAAVGKRIDWRLVRET
jgi:ribosome-binding protein aMBF1 (putative translation factor)